MGFTGSSIQNITKIKQSDVFSNIQQTVVGMVNVPVLADGEALALATLLTSNDGGLTWDSLTTPAYVAGTYAVDDEVYYEGHIYKNTVLDNTALPTDPSWTDLGAWDANGVLYNDLTESKKTTVVVTGEIKQKYLIGNDSFLQVALFKNKIIAK